MTTRDQRRRIVEVLRLQGDHVPPRVPGPAARRRILEVMRLEAGLPARPEEAVRPGDRTFRRGRAGPIDTRELDAERERWEARARKRQRVYAQHGLIEDALGRVHCAACGEWVPARTKGIYGGSPKALAIWHAFHCKAGGP